MTQQFLSWIYIKKEKQKNKTLIRKDSCAPMFRVALFIIAKIWKPPKCPSTDEWIKKMWCMHTHTHTMECYLAMDLEDMMLSEISQTDKDKRCMKPPTCGIQTNATNE